MSIFSINDNSNYNSILSQAKANKESKENSKISFANAFLKQNASSPQNGTDFAYIILIYI
ncbi:hypothetical protein RC32_03855 [Campylobacter jejuni]|nr:hypothetical protein RC32_03855 [Campylobacter jejuni]